MPEPAAESSRRAHAGRASFPPPGEAPDRLRLTRQLFAEYAAMISDRDGEAAERLLASLVTDLSVDDQQRADSSSFVASSGKQSMRTMLEKVLVILRKNPAVLREALLDGGGIRA